MDQPTVSGLSLVCRATIIDEFNQLLTNLAHILSVSINGLRIGPLSKWECNIMSSKWTIFVEAAIVVGVLTAGIATAQAAHAAPLQAVIQAADPRANVKIESKILVERTERNAAGETVNKLHPPSDIKVVPGDKLIFINSYSNTGSTAVTGFVVNNPVHSAVAFSSVSEDWATVSVDGGKNFAKLTELTVSDTVEASEEKEVTTITRAAQPSDVTHIRWKFGRAIAANASGELRFSGVVK